MDTITINGNRYFVDDQNGIINTFDYDYNY